MHCVVVGDIIQSRGLNVIDRRESSEIINRILDNINTKYADNIVASFGMVRGDAFEGVLFSQQYAPKIIQEIIKSLYLESQDLESQVMVRISAATDDLAVVSSNRNQADGRAFHIAMKKMEALRKRKSDHWFQVSMATNSVAQPMVDGLLRLIAALTEKWTKKQTKTVWYMMDCSNQQKLVSKKLGISASGVSKQLKAAKYDAYFDAWNSLEQFLIAYEEAMIAPQEITPDYTTYYSIAKRKNKQRDYSSAAKFFLKSLDLAKRVFDENSPNLVPIYNGLAESYLEQLSEEYDDTAKGDQYELQEKVKQIIEASFVCQKTLPKTRLEYAQTLNLYGNYNLELKNYDRALSYYNEAVEIVKDIYGTNHPLLYSCINNIAIAYKQKKEYETALHYYNIDLQYAEQNKDREPLSYADSLYNIGLCYYAMSQYNQALKYLQASQKTLISILPAKHPYIMEVQEEIEKISIYVK